MNKLRALAVLFAALGIAHGIAHAQVLEVPGDHATIQAALDAAPPGAVIVTLVGDPAPQLEGGGPPPPEYPWGLPVWTPPILLYGPGSGEVVLSRIDTGAFVATSYSVRPALYGGGFDELHVYDSEIIAPDVGSMDGLGFGQSAIDTDVPFVVIERSRVKGSRTDIDDACIGNPGSWSPAPGIRTPGEVVVLESHVSGGDTGIFRYQPWPTPDDCEPANCPSFPGGIGIECATLLRDGSTIEGGRGARWITCFDPVVVCCESEPGAATFVTFDIPLGDDLGGSGPIVLGRSYDLDFQAPGPVGELFLSLGLDPPFVVPGLGLNFLEPATTVSLGTVTTPGHRTLRIPMSATLLGRTLAFQLVDPVVGYSRPVASVVHPSNHAPHGDPTGTVTRTF